MSKDITDERPFLKETTSYMSEFRTAASIDSYLLISYGDFTQLGPLEFAKSTLDWFIRLGLVSRKVVRSASQTLLITPPTAS